MKNTTNKPTREQLAEYLAYDSQTGILTWIKRPSKRIFAGTRAGNQQKSGYRHLYFKGKNYPEHHIAWCMYYGEFPTEQIDHINQVRNDNRIENLREVTKAENSRNRARAKRTKVGEVGIWYCRRRHKYIAEITYNGKKVYQRSFDDIDEAIRQRRAKALELGFHDNHGQQSN